MTLSLAAALAFALLASAAPAAAQQRTPEDFLEGQISARDRAGRDSRAGVVPEPNPPVRVRRIYGYAEVVRVHGTPRAGEPTLWIFQPDPSLADPLLALNERVTFLDPKTGDTIHDVVIARRRFRSTGDSKRGGLYPSGWLYLSRRMPTRSATAPDEAGTFEGAKFGVSLAFPISPAYALRDATPASLAAAVRTAALPVAHQQVPIITQRFRSYVTQKGIEDALSPDSIQREVLAALDTTRLRSLVDRFRQIRTPSGRLYVGTIPLFDRSCRYPDYESAYLVLVVDARGAPVYQEIRADPLRFHEYTVDVDRNGQDELLLHGHAIGWTGSGFTPIPEQPVASCD